MSDSPIKKSVLNTLHSILHILFIPAVALLKGLIMVLTYLHDELVTLGTPKA